MFEQERLEVIAQICRRYYREDPNDPQETIKELKHRLHESILWLAEHDEDPEYDSRLNKAAEDLQLHLATEISDLDAKIAEEERRLVRARVFMRNALGFLALLWTSVVSCVRRAQVKITRGKTSAVFPFQESLEARDTPEESWDKGAREKDGWVLKRDTPEPSGKFCPTIHNAPKGPDALIDFLAANRCAGHRQAQGMVRNQEKISAAWQEFTLIFLGSDWDEDKGEDGEECMASRCYARLRYSKEHCMWGMSFFWGDEFPKNFKAVTYEMVNE